MDFQAQQPSDNEALPLSEEDFTFSLAERAEALLLTLDSLELETAGD